MLEVIYIHLKTFSYWRKEATRNKYVYTLTTAQNILSADCMKQLLRHFKASSSQGAWGPSRGSTQCNFTQMAFAGIFFPSLGHITNLLKEQISMMLGILVLGKLYITVSLTKPIPYNSNIKLWCILLILLVHVSLWLVFIPVLDTKWSIIVHDTLLWPIPVLGSPIWSFSVWGT